MPKNSHGITLDQEIRTALGKDARKPLTLWYISPEMANRLQPASVECMTRDPSLLVELFYPARGGLIIAIYYAKCGQAELEDILDDIAAENHLSLCALA
jgi:hypothetical protein